MLLYFLFAVKVGGATSVQVRRQGGMEGGMVLKGEAPTGCCIVVLVLHSDSYREQTCTQESCNIRILTPFKGPAVEQVIHWNLACLICW